MSTQIAGYRVGPCPPEFRAIAQEDYADYAASLSRSSRTSTGPGSGPTTTTERMLLENLVRELVDKPRAWSRLYGPWEAWRESTARQALSRLRNRRSLATELDVARTRGHLNLRLLLDTPMAPTLHGQRCWWVWGQFVPGVPDVGTESDRDRFLRLVKVLSDRGDTELMTDLLIRGEDFPDGYPDRAYVDRWLGDYGLPIDL